MQHAPYRAATAVVSPYDETRLQWLRCEAPIAVQRPEGSRRPARAPFFLLAEGIRESLEFVFVGRRNRCFDIAKSDIMWLAVYSARRQSEMTLLLFSDNDARNQTGVVRNLEHPTDRTQFRGSSTRQKRGRSCSDGIRRAIGSFRMIRRLLDRVYSCLQGAVNRGSSLPRPEIRGDRPAVRGRIFDR